MSETSAPKMVSMMAQEITPGGNEFGILRTAKPEAASIRGRALDSCIAIASERAPELLHHLKSNASAEYMMSGALAHAEDLRVKGDLARIIIESNIEEGHYHHAIQMLTYGGTEEADLPEYQNYDFLGKMYKKARDQNDLYASWRVADEVVRLQRKKEIGKVVKYPARDENWEQGWETREQNAFAAYAQDLLERAQGDGDVREWKLDLLFQEFRFRPEGFEAKQPSKLSQDVAKAYCDHLAQDPRHVWRALIHADEAKMPQNYITELETKLPVADKASRKFNSAVSELISGLQSLVKRER